MKKVLFVFLVLSANSLWSNQSFAQQKMGYFDEQFTLSLFPGIQKVDSLINIYQNDSLRVEYEYRYNDLVLRDSIFRKDSATMKPKARELAIRELNMLKYNIGNWQSYSQQMIEAKLVQLLAPYRQKISEALKAVAAEQKYTYVFSAAALDQQYILPPLLDNLSIRVAMKLKLPLSKEIEVAWRVANAAASVTRK